jgi:hypothetical protein
MSKYSILQSLKYEIAKKLNALLLYLIRLILTNIAVQTNITKDKGHNSIGTKFKTRKNYNKMLTEVYISEKTAHY